jgi:hypothetical protein
MRKQMLVHKPMQSAKNNTSNAATHRQTFLKTPYFHNQLVLTPSTTP